MDKRILVALTFNAALALGKVSRTPRAIQVMQSHQPVLYVGSGSHFGGTAQQDTHLPGAHLGEQFFFPYLGVAS